MGVMPKGFKMFKSLETCGSLPAAVVRRARIVAICASLFLLSISPVAAADDARCLVSFDSARLDVCAGRLFPAREEVRHLGDLEAFRDAGVRVVKFEGPIFAHQRAALEALGAEILEYAPFYAYIVRMPAALDERVAGIDGVLWTGPFLPVWKVDVNIATELAERSIVEQAGLTQLVVSLHRGVEAEAVLGSLAGASGLAALSTEAAGSRQRIVFEFARPRLSQAVAALAAHESVASVGLRWPPALMNSQAGWLHQSGVGPVNPERPVFDQGIFGCGQVLAVLDSGLHTPHCSFEDTGMTPVFTSCNLGAGCPAVSPDFTHRKVGVYYGWSGGASPGDSVGHGTHVTGSAIGNDHAAPVDCAGLTTPGGITNLDGTAPGAKLVFQELGATFQYITAGGNIYHAADVAFSNGARIHSNSWGFRYCRNPPGSNTCVPGCTTPYDASSQDADEVAWDNPELLILAAAGNDGANSCGPGADVGTFANAKSVFTIGSNNRGANGNNMSGFSTRGPASDRRTKPEVTAQGGPVFSAQTNSACGSVGLQGTSMATPTAAGLAGLVREYLARGFYPTGAEDPANVIPNPTGALIRAMMINGAVEITGTGANPPAPNQDQGWGRVHLDNVLYFAGDSRQLWIHEDPGVSTGGVVANTIDAQAGQPLVVTLVWHDFPAMPSANPHIVNELRLEVETPGGVVWTQKLSPGGGLANADPFQDTTATDYDDRNTVHRITLPAPATGPYLVRVTGINVPQGPQAFALVVTGTLGTGPLPLDVNPVLLDFGGVPVGQVSSNGAVTLTNINAADVDVDSISPAAAPFQITADTTCATPPFTLIPGETCELVYNFSPTAQGTLSQDFDIVEPGGNSVGQFTLEGTGTGVPELTISPDPVDFGVRRVNDFSSLDVTFSSTGAAAVDVQIMDAPAAPFFFFGLGTCPPLPFTLQPGDNCTRSYAFEPSADGMFSQQIDVGSTDPNPNNFTLQGEGVHAVINIDPSDIDFGLVAVGSQAVAGITVSNAGAMFDIDVFNPAMSPLPPEFDIQPGTCAPFPFTLAPGQDCELEVIFTPAAPGAVLETNELTHDASDGSAGYMLQGLGIDGPWLTIDPVPLDFGAHLVGQVSASAVTIANIGNAPLDLTSVTSAPAPFDEAGGTCLPLPVSLNPGDDCTLEFTFEPAAPGGFVHPMAIDSNDPASPHGFELRGDGVANPVFDDRFEGP